MKRLICSICLLLAAAPLAAQLYHPGEVLQYRVSYRAKMFPNTEVGTVEVATAEETFNGEKHYKVTGYGRTLPTYRWFFNLEDLYTVWIDREALRPVCFESDIREGDYTFDSRYRYDWADSTVYTRWRSRKRPYREKQMPLTDTVRVLRYRFLGREIKKIRNMGRFRTLKFNCQLGSSQGYSFTDGSVFTIWISDDRNKIPLYIESPVRIGSINAYISGYKGLKYPVESLVK